MQVSSCLFLLLSPSLEAVAEKSWTSSPILIGSSTALTGPPAAIVKGFNRGSELFIDRLNAEGGIYGRKVKVVVRDDGYEPQRTLEDAKALIEKDGVFCLFNNYGSSGGVAIAPLMDKSDVPLVGPIASSEALRAPLHRNVFTVRASSKVEIEHILKYALEQLKFTEIGIIYQNDALGEGIRLAAVAALHEKGLKLKFSEPLAKRSTDAASAVSMILSKKPQAVLLGLQVEAAANVFNEVQKTGFHPTFLGSAIIATREFTSLLANPREDGNRSNIYVTLVTPPLDQEKKYPLVSEFLKIAKTENVVPDETVFEGYINAKVLAEGLKKTGKELTRQKFRLALESMSPFDLGGLKVNYTSESHRGSSDVFLAILKNNSFISVGN